MSVLTLPSFEVKGFRAFKDLRIERLGRVNLIVGKNNVGKTSLLEAIQLYASQGNPALIWEQLTSRDEMQRRSNGSRAAVISELLSSLRHLFLERPDLVRRHVTTMKLGPVDSPDSMLTLSVDRLPDRTAIGLDTGTVARTIPMLTIRIGKHPATHYPIEQTAPDTLLQLAPSPLQVLFVLAHEFTPARLSELWDRVALTGVERNILDALRIIAPGVEGIGFVAAPTGTAGDRIPIVRIAGMDEPIPLRSLGGGIQRMLGIALALVNAKDGIVLVDGVENGLHYTVLPQLWRLIFETARRLNVQVFATSHSWECLEAFQQAAEDDRESEGLLIRLQLKGEEIVAVLVDEEHLGVATSERIEVR
jgi:hypothetical protein